MSDCREREELYYAAPIYRPPSEAYSLLIQATVGCSSAAAGRCHFCNSTLFHRVLAEKQFRIRPLAEILADIDIAGRQNGASVTKIFLLDSNALVMKTPDLLKILKKCYATFPRLKQVSCYGCCEDILRKTPRELNELRQAGLTLVFVGLESGDQQVLDLVKKGVTVEQQIEAVVKANSAGLQTSVTIILGLGGRALSEKHAVNTGLTVSAMNPSYLAALTLMLVPGTILHDMMSQGEFVPLTAQLELLRELELLLANITVPGPVVFRTNHASNYLVLKGTLPQERDRMLATLRYAMHQPTALREESSRGL